MKGNKTKNAGNSPVTSLLNISDVSHHKAAASKAFLENHYRDLLRDTRRGGVREVGPRERELTANDFHLVKCIGRGAFGEVYVCRRVGKPNQLYALKRLRKMDMIRRKQVLHIRSEKDVLSEAATKNPWVVRLYASFQDEQYLYMVMEYMPGGDMISWLCEKGIFDVASTRFYIAELCIAVNSVHAMFFVHRDIKPDNILFGADGHIKLSDFGLSKRFAKCRDDEPLGLDYSVDSGGPRSRARSSSQTTPNEDHSRGLESQRSREGRGPGSEDALTDSPASNSGRWGDRSPRRRREMFQSIVGSAGYIAPEILLRHPYNLSCDWWSVGVIVYEMLYGIPPFYSSDPNTTCHKIMHWRKYLCFPSDKGIPDEAVDFISRLLCDPKDRMTFDEIARHPFLQGLDLDHMQEMKAAYTPVLSSPLDTRYFPEIDESTLSLPAVDDSSTVKEVDPRGVMFADFRFNYYSNRRRLSQTNDT
ncbi:unnamed protein product [Phytomonas sp. Hart1]|nr:unnamed protein product [Phytomonas sp. Hart1]|eukprot:CCW67617.1 unnamed protein product [Phytomonas sp. isolate Hart1]